MNVEDLLKAEGIYYKASGKDFVVHCLSPDHDDSNPSMRIDKVIGMFQCLSCGFRGNIFTHFGFKPDAVETARESLRRKIQKIRQESVGYAFPKDAMPYVGNWRGISPDTYRKFEAFKSTLPEFINRIVFPIRNAAGKIVVFQGRDDTGTLNKKYYNHPGGVQFPLFPTVTPIMDSVVVVEGIYDMLNLHDKGLTNTITTFGCTTITKKGALDLLKFQGVKHINLLYDNDKPGQDGTILFKEVAEKTGIEVTNRILPEGTDPGDLDANQVKNLKEKLYG